MLPTAQGLGHRDTLSRTLLHLHQRGGSASRAELTARLDCGRSVMGYLLNELTDLAVVTVHRDAPRPRGTDSGRPSHQVTIADTAPVVSAVHLGVDLLSVATVALGGRVLSRHDQRLTRSDTPDDVLDRIAEQIDAQRAPGPRLGVGLAVPSPVRRSDGVAVALLHLGWPALPLGRLLRQRMESNPHTAGLEVAIGNDANLAALAEHRHGAGQGSRQMLYLTNARVGLGGSLICDGEVFGGAHGYAIEPGHVTVDPAGAPCTCGSTGCLEVEADHRGLLRAAGMGDVPTKEIDAAVTTVLDDAQHGQPASVAAVHQVNARLGSGLASLINLTDPDRIVLGGTLGRLHQLAPDVVTNQLAHRSFLSHSTHISIQPEALPNSVLLGAAEIALQPLIDNPRLLRNRSGAHQ